MPVLHDISILYDTPDDGSQDSVVEIKNAALVWLEDKVVWSGPEKELPELFAKEARFSANGNVVIPGLIDCHTHLAFGGWRGNEFVERLRGFTYIDIAKSGGGIMSTVRSTRKMSKQDLKARAAGFLSEIVALGVTTVECKSGYGLTFEDEIKLLEVYKELETEQPVHLVSTFLGAHTIPAEFKENRKKYIQLIVEDMLPEIGNRKLARYCDVFVEETAISVAEAELVLHEARSYGLVPKVHADQMTGGHGAELAARVKARSADHLECITKMGMEQMKKAGVVAVSLPIATMYLQQRPLPSRELIRRGIEVAVATDFNPGTAPSFHLPYAMHLACVFQRMTPNEVLKGATIIAAKAIDEQTERGSLEPGKRADFAIFDIEDVTSLMYHFKPNSCVQTWIGGKKVWEKSR